MKLLTTSNAIRIAIALLSKETIAFTPFFFNNQQPLVDDNTSPSISYIARHLGQLSTYADLPPSNFNVSHTGIPSSCRISQVHLLQRHAERFPHPGDAQDGLNIEKFTQNIYNASIAGQKFDGALEFLNDWRNLLGGEYLTGKGALAEIAAGVQTWNRYGRLLYNASAGQLSYRPEYEKPLLRGTSQSRIHNSLMNFALGFFGPSFQETASIPRNWTDWFHTVVIPEGGDGSAWNNTLAAQHCCNNSQLAGVGIIGDEHMWNYASRYLPDATKRLSKLMPEGFNLDVKDTYAMQLLCAYELAYLGESDFCALFTKDEWDGFEQSLDIRFFYNHAFGNPTARAQGIGYVEELLARLKGEYIETSDSSVNSSLTKDEEHFPLGLKFYADFTHDKIVLGTLTALSLDFLRELPDLKSFPPVAGRKFRISHLVPFAARLVTEVIDCDTKDPEPVKHERYSASSHRLEEEEKIGKHRFVRMKLNGAVVPLSSIRGGQCKGRSDELCPLEDFLESQAKARERANYRQACFGDYEGPKDGSDVDGTVPRE